MVARMAAKNKMADMVADMEVTKVADKMANMVVNNKKWPT